MKRKPKKLTKAQQEAQDNWEKLNKKWDKIPKFSRVEVKVTSDILEYKLTNPRETPRVFSFSTPGGETNKVQSPVYTGDNVLGIAQMSKSNAVPVFAKQEAIDIARMRRG